MKIIGKFSSFKDSAKKRMDKFIEWSALHFFFLIGIGLTAIVSKVLFKRFLTNDYSFTSWKKRLTKVNLNKMY
ncbi:MAG: hypothetical protein GW942_00545 [Candidatus Pacebacteria bacterium]|nr:hypothetical protein [Candidatus Paceibacterota bacterium]